MLWGVYHKGMSCAESGGVLALAMGTTGTYVLGAAQESPVGMDGDAVRVPKFNGNGARVCLHRADDPRKRFAPQAGGASETFAWKRTRTRIAWSFVTSCHLAQVRVS